MKNEELKIKTEDRSRKTEALRSNGRGLIENGELKMF